MLQIFKVQCFDSVLLPLDLMHGFDFEMNRSSRSLYIDGPHVDIFIFNRLTINVGPQNLTLQSTCYLILRSIWRIPNSDFAVFAGIRTPKKGTFLIEELGQSSSF